MCLLCQLQSSANHKRLCKACPCKPWVVSCYCCFVYFICYRCTRNMALLQRSNWQKMRTRIFVRGPVIKFGHGSLALDRGCLQLAASVGLQYLFPPVMLKIMNGCKPTSWGVRAEWSDVQVIPWYLILLEIVDFVIHTTRSRSIVWSPSIAVYMAYPRPQFICGPCNTQM